MKIPRQLSFVASMALVLTSAPAWSQPQESRPAPAPTQRAKRVQGVQPRKAAQEQGERARKARQQQGEKNAQRAQNARNQQQGQKNAQRAQNARNQQQGEKNAQRAQNARQKQQAEANAERTQNARNQQQADKNAQRAKNARDKQQAEKGAARAKDARRTQQALNASAVRLLGAEIKKHETNVARIDKLTAIYTRTGDEGKLARVRALQKAEDARYAKVIARFKGSLGETGFAQVRSRLERSKR